MKWINYISDRFDRLSALAVVIMIMIVAVVSETGSDEQVRINGRIVTLESVVAGYGGDSLAAAAASTPLPVSAPYLTPARVKAEHIYNSFALMRLCAVSALLLFIVSLCVHDPKKILRFSLLPLILISVEIVLTGIIGEALPLVSVSDTLRVVALLLLVIPMLFRSPSAPAYAVAAGLVIVAEITSIHPAIKLYNPILDSSWLPVHVASVLAAYSFFIFAAVSAKGNYTCILYGEIFLGCGILFGSLWAGEAWGSYWSWDPKETAALVSFAIYLALILMKRHVSRWMACAALVSVLFTWFFITAGMHAY